MTRPRSSRSTIPSHRVLGLSGAHAQQDLIDLEWTDEEHVPILWALAATGDPDLTLNNVVRLCAALEDAQSRGEDLSQGAGGEACGEIPDATLATLHRMLVENAEYRARLFALFGSSTMLGDHIVANPDQWVRLAKDLPTRDEMMDLMLGVVDAQHVPEAGELVYRAGVVGPEADEALRTQYRTLLARIASLDVASTTVHRGQESSEPLEFEVVSGLLSDAADAALTAALAVACATVFGRAGSEETQEVPGHLAVLAMGKCGAQELNYISDVDVIFVAEPADAKATRWAGEFINIGSRLFFEVDAALRPEGKAGALVRTLDSHVKYYDRWAHTWEFQAQLKARPMAGDLELGQAYVDALAPKVWTASEREDFVPDVQAMRRRVLDNVPEDLRERELKLGQGGLRDVEFAVQLLQLVHGRTDENLRVLSTVKALRALVDGGYVGREDGQTLVKNYEYLRLLEHRLQLQRLKRTHVLPPADDEATRTWLARTAGCRPEQERTHAEQLDAEVRRTAREVKQLHTKLFYRPLLASVAALDADVVRLSKDAAIRQFHALGFYYPDRAYEHLTALASGTSRKAKLQVIILPSLLGWLAETVDPDTGLLNYRLLSEKAKDRPWFLRLLRDESIVGQRLMHILGTSPYASDLLMNSLDSIKLLSDGANGPKFMDREPSVVTHSLVAAAGRYSDPDKAIERARSLRRAELARIAIADLLGFMDIESVCQSLSWVWDAVLEAALHAEITAWEDRKAMNAPARISVIGMGRLGGAELGYGSDADVMFVCEPVEGVEENDAVRWAIRIVDQVRTRLGRPTQDPPLDVDVDLRPEGRSGAVVRTLESYRRYYEEWGEVWEYQALLRATWIAGDKDLGIRFLHMIDQFRYPPGGVGDKTVQEVRRMKARVDAERLPRGADKNMHTKLGRGALTDVEWTVQLLTMMHGPECELLRNTSTLEVLTELANAEFISQADAEILRTAWITATKARNALVLVKGKRKDQLPAAGDDLRAVAAAAGWSPTESQEFLDRYLKATRKARRVVDRVFWGEDVGLDFEH
ncbi:bifunctional [glutamine synthetase] adenylyltransferase/[glutamine synthetase]-adenylyl-L-tyrosine phosphorylase [Corynebacterium sp. 320]|uniref:bifunctional [glutamine synthetase] adenylyltransferase/[glutamine synthetase]-adenylyl-L-tyrosine phosphorylase n=1 Tax=Corynebacterium TaxID=1716 RepID=UPI00125CC0EF|nr:MULTISPECIES: bifunctional [glutamine synthetase] adenylyltransferase/[glutamine synthetase]-adenylyl-L-tyrosine phosphorylase [Corynebacterium]KAB1502446.1 bifunctional [glutamine synthetase] adenylyltransferase/[glutamine synthetase]-adenylyl-L-tyrosine phosphorylase [Corynebacterium sp. 320]KAB1551333.1 bifunctional [glutamine synthetase] adenylyltransferase/[glutamine synthetase]-adenylyl-L-tyrosine phosphorylase [Corynebacterium sp. 321]KAB1551838.1 bifunctional [glutamine synthetase] ad